jgi:hypothetical protein
MTDPIVSVIIVSWNVRDLLRRCLQSVLLSPEFAPGAVEVIVVDNASGDGTAQVVRGEFPAVRLLANDGNAGFTAGCNQGLAAAAGRYNLLLNPDTELVGDALAAMVRVLDADSGIALVGPRLVHPQGDVQSSRRRFPTLATAFVESTVLQGLFEHSGILNRYYLRDRSDDEEQDVDWLVGAALLVRRQVVQQVGGLDVGYFMYSEELDWCRRIKAAASPSGGPWRIRYTPSATIIHHEGSSSEQAVPARHINFQSSKVRYFRKYHGRVAAALLRCFLLATYVWQLAEESAKWLLGSKRPLRAGRVRAYAHVIASGLNRR